MTKKPVGWVALCLFVAAATPAYAEDAGSNFEPYTAGYPPENNLLELGVVGGLLLPANDQNLRNERFRNRNSAPRPSLGLAWVGIRSRSSESKAKPWAE